MTVKEVKVNEALLWCIYFVEVLRGTEVTQADALCN